MKYSVSLSRRFFRLLHLCFVMVGLLLPGAFNPASAYEKLVKKQVFTLPSYTTMNGETIKQVKVGWEAYGTLNEARDNVILITHYFSGHSHAAGKYHEDDPASGYWDSIIGSGKPIDTDHYYVISSDSLVNVNAGLPTVTTTGPASINPDTGKPYGMTFPIVTIRDFVNVQHALLAHLGIERLHAIMGASMGAQQAIEWASAYPEMVERVIPVIGSGETDAFLIAGLNRWAAPIRLDPAWNEGAYYGKQPPLRGLTEAFKLVTLHASHWKWASETYGRAWAEEDKNPLRAMEHRYRIEAELERAASARAAISDANHFLYLVKATQSFTAGYGDSLQEGLAHIDAPTLLIYAEDDLIFPPASIQETARLIGADATPVSTVPLRGTRGHLDGLFAIKQAGKEIKGFLEK